METDDFLKEGYEGIIDSKYFIIQKIGYGGQSGAYLVTKDKKDDKYVAKVFNKDDDESYNGEIKALTDLNKFNNPNIIKLIEYGKGLIKRKNRETLKRQYLILEYASHGTFIDYIIGYSGFGEKLTKIIFEKILKIIQFCHSKGYCHLDIKPENILLKEDYTLVLSDFGFATLNKPNLEIYRGTCGYRSPQITGTTPYNGFMEDIFSLGVSLLSIAYGVKGFIEAKPDDEVFKIIIAQNFELFWAIVENLIAGPHEEISQEFKDLYLRMISINPKDRPTIGNILKDNLFNEIQNMTEKEKNDLLKTEFLKREEKSK